MDKPFAFDVKKRAFFSIAIPHPAVSEVLDEANFLAVGGKMEAYQERYVDSELLAEVLDELGLEEKYAASDEKLAAVTGLKAIAKAHPLSTLRFS